MPKPLRIILFVLLGVVLFIGGIFGVAMFATSGVADAGDKFMNALKARDYTTAWNLCTQEVHADIPTAKGLEELISGQQVEPVEWSYSSRSMENGEGELAGNVTFANKETGSLSLVLRKVEGEWMIRGFRLRSAFATEVNAVAEQFLGALKSRDYSAAWNLCGQPVRNDISSPAALSTMIRSLEVEPIFWSYEISKSGQDEGAVNGEATFADSAKGSLAMLVKKQGDIWKIQMFRLERELTTESVAELDTIANRFLNALKEGDFASAWNQCSPEVRADVPTPDALSTVILGQNIQPAQWSLSSTTNSVSQSGGQQGVIVGSVTFTSGNKGSANIILQKQEGQWVIRGFHLKEGE